MNNGNDTFKTPERQGKFLLITSVVVVAIIIGLIYLMASGPSDESVAADLVEDTLASMPSGELSAIELRAIGKKLHEALDLAPNLDATQDALVAVQRQIENQIHVAITEGRLENLEDLLFEASQIWPNQTQFDESGIYRARLTEKQRETELQQRLRTRMSEMVARLESDPSHTQSLRQAIDLIEELIQGDESDLQTDLTRNSLSELVRSTTGLALSAQDVADTRRMLETLKHTMFEHEDYAQLREALSGKLAEAERDRQIYQLLEEADVHLRNDRLSMPEGRNALFNFRQVLVLDSENPAALNGVKRIEARYVALADQALIENELTRAHRFIDTLARISPEQGELARLQDKLQSIQDSLIEGDEQDNLPTRTQASIEPAKPNEEVAEIPVEELLDDDESRLWNQVRYSCKQEELRKYINTYPSGRYVQDAWQRISDCLAQE